MFDDLIPENKNTATATPTVPKGRYGALMFDDLVPKKRVRGASNSPFLVKATNPDNINRPIFEYDKDDSTLINSARLVGNVPKSVYNIGEGLFNMVRHPIETAGNIGNLVAGTAGLGAEKLIENTNLGQKFLQKANESRIARGIAPLKAGVDGKLQAEDNEQTLMSKNMGAYFKDRLGSLEAIKRTAVEDPAGLALDVSSIFTGGASIAPKIAQVAEAADLGRTANVIRNTGTVAGKVGEFIDPIRQTAKAVTPTVLSKAKDVGDLFKKPGKELQSEALKRGLYGMNETVGTLKQKFEDTSYTYKARNGEIIDVNPIDTFVQYDLIPLPGRGGSLDVSMIKEQIPTLMKEIEDKIDLVLMTAGKTISIAAYAKQLDASINSLRKSKMFKTELTTQIHGVKKPLPGDKKHFKKVQKYLQKVQQHIHSELDTMARSYPDGQIPLDEINYIRKEANGEYRDDKIDLARVRGNATREIVYNSTPDQRVKDFLNEERKLINAGDYAKKLAIHKVKGGGLGNYVYSGLGAVMGTAINLPAGLGPFLGAVGGRGLSEVIQRRQLRSIPADLKAGLENKIFGDQKSPNKNPANITANTTDKSGSISKTLPQAAKKTTKLSTPKKGPQAAKKTTELSTPKKVPRVNSKVTPKLKENITRKSLTIPEKIFRDQKTTNKKPTNITANTIVKSGSRSKTLPQAAKKTTGLSTLKKVPRVNSKVTPKLKGNIADIIVAFRKQTKVSPKRMIELEADMRAIIKDFGFVIPKTRSEQIKILDAIYSKK